MVEHLFLCFCYQMAGIISKEDNSSLNQMSRQEEIVFVFLTDLSEHHLTERTVEFYAERQSITTDIFPLWSRPSQVSLQARLLL